MPFTCLSLSMSLLSLSAVSVVMLSRRQPVFDIAPPPPPPAPELLGPADVDVGVSAVDGLVAGGPPEGAR